ncbi:transcriptional regulator [Candidatus Woesearchaeota archaeon]|nr:MAG: transcriptional regulator [Candidatus Woesearchaeota archaeon]
MGRRTHEQIRKIILKRLQKGQSTINEISQSTGLTWRTVQNHLIYLIGTGKVEPVFISKYVKIYKLKGGECE